MPTILHVVRRLMGAAVALVILDAVWLQGAGTSSMYKSAVEAVQGGRPMKLRWGAAAMAYLFLAVGVAVYAGVPWPAARVVTAAAADIHPASICWPASGVDSAVTASLGQVAAWAAGWGLVVYGVYNATTAALLQAYPTHVAVADTLWGGTLAAAVAAGLWTLGW